MLNEKGQRELAYIVKIDGILPIEGADRVAIATAIFNYPLNDCKGDGL